MQKYTTTVPVLREAWPNELAKLKSLSQLADEHVANCKHLYHRVRLLQILQLDILKPITQSDSAYEAFMAASKEGEIARLRAHYEAYREFVQSEHARKTTCPNDELIRYLNLDAFRCSAGYVDRLQWSQASILAADIRCRNQQNALCRLANDSDESDAALHEPTRQMFWEWQTECESLNAYYRAWCDQETVFVAAFVDEAEREIRKRIATAQPRRPGERWEDERRAENGARENLYYDTGYKPRAGESVPLYKVNFAPILAGIEQILDDARQLADWAGDKPLDETGADMLLRVGVKWLLLEPALNAIGIGASAQWHGGNDDDEVFAGAQCLNDLARAVRENNVWFAYLPKICPHSLVDLAPEAVMGMPHATFAKRLAVAVDLLRKAVSSARETSDTGMTPHQTGEPETNQDQLLDGEGSTRKRMSRAEANAKAMKLAEADDKFVFKTQREWAREIGCAVGLITNLPFWRGVAARTDRDRQGKGRAPRVVNLSDKLLADTPDSQADDPQEAALNRLAAQEEARARQTAKPVSSKKTDQAIP
jgi:hypothetical protein